MNWYIENQPFSKSRIECLRENGRKSCTDFTFKRPSHWEGERQAAEHSSRTSENIFAPSVHPTLFHNQMSSSQYVPGVLILDGSWYSGNWYITRNTHHITAQYGFSYMFLWSLIIKPFTRSQDGGGLNIAPVVRFVIIFTMDHKSLESFFENFCDGQTGL